MTKQKITDKILTIISNELKIESKEIIPESTFYSLGASTHDIVDIIIDIEKVFKIIIPDKIALGLNTVTSIINYIDITINKK
jgi:acyl carrier protein